MKPLLYIGAALMMGAGIYGFVDYKKKNQKKGIVVPFVSSRAAHFVSSGVLCFPFVSRLASLARSRLGPAQYHR